MNKKLITIVLNGYRVDKYTGEHLADEVELQLDLSESEATGVQKFLDALSEESNLDSISSIDIYGIGGERDD